MIAALGRLLARLLGREVPPEASEPDMAAIAAPMDDLAPTSQADGHLVPYDENLLERARTQWQFGDWDSLAALERDTLQHHPDRAKLALLAAAGRLQTGHASAAHHYIRLALNWGCSERLVKQILIAGVHNSLGRTATLLGQDTKALDHFQQAIAIGAPGAEARLLSQARSHEQRRQLQSWAPPSPMPAEAPAQPDVTP